MKKKWIGLTQLAAWIVSTVSPFIIPIPFNEFNTTSLKSLESYSKLNISFAEFITAAIIGLSIIPFQIFQAKKYYKRWYISSLFLLGFSIMLFFWYNSLQEKYVFRYPEGGNTIIIIGKELLPEALPKILKIENEEGRKLNSYDLLNYKAGRSEEIWAKKDIDQNRFKLLLLYYLNIIFFVLFILFLLQGIRSYSGISITEDLVPIPETKK